MELEQTSFGGWKTGAFVEVRGPEECGALRGKKLVGYGHRWRIEGDRSTCRESAFLWTRG